VNNENWLSDAPIGEWNGVTTDGSGRVIELSFFGNQLSGCVPEGLRDVDSNDLSELGLPFCSN
jgi:hypothetical protein